MPEYEIWNDQKIRVIFKGFIIAYIEEGMNPAQIGALSALAPPHDVCHQPKISAYKIVAENGEVVYEYHGFKLDETFSLIVNRPKRVRIFQKDDNPFVPFDIHNHPKDFRWFVNLNKIHGLTPTRGLSGSAESGIKIKPNTLKPIFTIDDGLFHTSDRSDAEARLQRLKLNERDVESEQAFGRVALEMTARIYLEGHETADFYNGLDRIFEANAGDEYIYDIVFDCRCLINEDLSDFGHVYDVIELPPGTKKVDLVPDLILPTTINVTSRKAGDRSARKDIAASPEVYCFGGTFP